MTTTADAPVRSGAPLRSRGGSMRTRRLLVLLVLIGLAAAAALASIAVGGG